MAPTHACDPAKGLLAHLVGKVRPSLAKQIAVSSQIETGVIGLGRQGTRHAGLMMEFGTVVAAAVSPESGLTRVHEKVPVYRETKAMMEAHPHIAAVSVWKHFSTAADSAIEAIEANVPIVVIISEGIPVKDVRRVLDAARRKRTLVFGPNTPGLIFPPERVKIGMLPDIFQAAENGDGQHSAEGVTICSRSGAILYHLSDALASAGIAQNGVLGVGGDAAIGTPFPALVPMVMDFPGTDLVVVAGEVGGCQEELLAEDIKAHPERYPKPIVALISGRCAPVGKTMGHAGAIVSPGTAYGTYESKRAALDDAGVVVVNSQFAFKDAVRSALGRKTYFDTGRYYARMKALWDAPPPIVLWTTSITDVKPNSLSVRGIPLTALIEEQSLLEVAALLVEGALPSKATVSALETVAIDAVRLPVPRCPLVTSPHLSRRLASLLLSDEHVAAFEGSPVERTVFCLGRLVAYFAHLFDARIPSEPTSFAALAYAAITGREPDGESEIGLLESAAIASVDHGVTPPSAQATIIAASVRAQFEVALASGLAAITDVHGGAGASAAVFFRTCVDAASTEGTSLRIAAEKTLREYSAAGKRIEGLGHRLHQRDPRRDALWKKAHAAGVAGSCVATSMLIEDAFASVRGLRIPINVDGVLGAIVADMQLHPRVATALFLFGRAAGLAAHYFEEVETQPPMRQIHFDRATYRPN